MLNYSSQTRHEDDPHYDQNQITDNEGRSTTSQVVSVNVEIDVDYLEIQLFFSWFFRFIPYDSCNFGLPDCFITINAIVDRAWKELDYIEILRRLRNLKDTFN